MSTPLFEMFLPENASGVAFKNKSLKRAIIIHLDTARQSTVADLTRELNISTPKIITLLNELIEDGLIRDYGKVDSTGGRRASLYGMVSEAAYFVGVDVRKYSINIGLLDFNKNLVTTTEEISYDLDNSPEAFQQLLAEIKMFIADLSVPRNKIFGIGINLSGRINNEKGYSYSFFNFHEEPLATTMKNQLGIPVFLENDSRAMGYGEFHFGVVSSEKNVLFVNMDYGIGLGIFVDGRVYYGKSGFSGEFGHIPFFDNEILCHCGKKGCLETEASGNALLRMFSESIAAGSTSQLVDKPEDAAKIKLEEIIDAALSDDMLSIELVTRLGEKMGKGLAVLINIFNPELVILGGALAKTGDLIRLPIKIALNKYSLSLVNNDTQVKMSKLGDRAGVMGGCLIARNNVFFRKYAEA